MSRSWIHAHISDEQLITAWNAAVSIADCSRKLDLLPTGSNQSAIANHASKLGLTRDHMKFKGALWTKRKHVKTKEEFVASLANSSDLCSYRSSTHLRDRLLFFELKKPMCEVCNTVTWNNRPVPLQLDHIDGNALNNALENLRILCPNCHAQTSTFCRSRAFKGKLKCIDCNQPTVAEHPRCLLCCRWPPLSDLIARLKIKTYKEVAQDLGVTHTVLKWHVKNRCGVSVMPYRHHRPK